MNAYSQSEARSIALLVMQEICGFSTLNVLTGCADSLSDDKKSELETIFSRISKGEPVQYVLGTADFCGLKFHVEPGVLIPRPETEELVAWTEATFHEIKGKSILDIGTGSGCIAISLAKRIEDAEVEAWDISKEALRIASKNAESINANVMFSECDILSPLQTKAKKFSAIVSNPPYICNKEKADMERNVLEHEPALALFVTDSDPLLFYKAISQKAVSSLLSDKGALLFEVNRTYANEVAEVMKEHGFTNIEIRKDFIGNDRMVRGFLNK